MTRLYDFYFPVLSVAFRPDHFPLLTLSLSVSPSIRSFHTFTLLFAPLSPPNFMFGFCFYREIKNPASKAGMGVRSDACDG